MKYILLPLIFTLNALNAQFLPIVPYEKINFDGLYPDWYETSYDTTGVSDSLDGYNNFSFTFNVPELYFKDLIVKPYFSRSPFGKNGSYIECRSVDDGQLKWQQKFTLDDIDHIELIAYMYVDKDDQLVVISHKERKPYVKYDFQFYFTDMILTRRVYNIYNGNLISYFHRDYNDPKSYKTSNSSFPIGSSIIFLENGNFRYIEKFSKGDSLYLKSCLLDETGALVAKEDTMLIEKFSNALNIVRIHQDTLLEVQMNRNTHHLYLRYLSPNLKLYNEIASDSLPWDPANISLQQVSSDGGKLLFINYFPSNGIPNLHHEFIVLNRSGNLIKYGFLPFKDFDYNILEWEDDSPNFLVIDRYHDQTGGTLKSLMRLFRLGPESTMQQIKSFITDNKLRFATPISSKKLNSQKYYLNFVEGAYKPGINVSFLDFNAMAYSQMVVNIANLGLSNTTNENESLNSSLVVLYPNPVKDQCNIIFDDVFTGKITVYNSKGDVMESVKVHSLLTLELNTSMYNSGFYFIICTEEENSKNIISGKFIKFD